MNLTKTYHQKTTPLENLSLQPYIEGVSFKGGYQGTCNEYRFEVDVKDYLSVAKKAVKELRAISGMEYCIMAKHPNGNTWREV